MGRLLAPLMLALVLLLAPSARADQTDPALDALFKHLQAAGDADEARAIEDAIWDRWLRRGVPEIDRIMALGIVEAGRGNLKRSLDLFDRVVKAAPDFAEAWNKRATIHYMLGNYTASVADIRRTLALEPRHFGALSGMGLIYDAIGDADAAVRVWEKALEIHPRMETIRQRIKDLRASRKGNPT